MKVAIFDLDGTLILEETLPYMLKAWGKLGHSKWAQFKMTLRMLTLFTIYKIGWDSSLDKEVFRKKATIIFLELFKGMNSEEMKDFFRDYFKMLDSKINHEVVARLELAKQNGYRTILLSGGYLPFVEIVGEHFGFDEAIGSKIRYTEDGYVDYSDPVVMIMGKKKLEALEESCREIHCDWAESMALADSYYDIELLNHVGQPIAVNPDEKLKSHAEACGWEIIN